MRLLRIQMLSITALICLCVALFGCTQKPIIKKEYRFKYYACLVVYCEASENSLTKRAGLKIIEIASNSIGAKAELDRGICEEYYSNRNIATGYIYANKSALEVCEE